MMNLILSIFLLIFSLIFLFFSIYFIVLNKLILLEYVLFSLNSSNVMMTVLFDWMSLMFMSFVLLISSMVIYYSKDYMQGDLNMSRFILLVFLFVLSMMFLIISPNLVSIMLGWDGLGLVSYCLVIYYQNFKSFNAGMLTALTNRLGDVALLMAIAWMINYGSWNYIYYFDYYNNNYSMKIICWLVIIAALTKSAQIPFSSWLPAAMAAPTPVSSLVHSSTLVTAGVYLLIRFNYVFDLNMKYFLLFISSLTMFMSGMGANFEFDLKKIIALSTLSQLGLMISILALGSYELAFFHLLTHALFKALLFMCAGNMIHSYSDCQDIRFLGGMINILPLTSLYFNISNLSLCGLPFLSGFYSKDLIVELMSMSYLNIYIYMIFYVSIGLTVCYSFRLYYYLMINKMNFFKLNNINDLSFVMLLSMTGLIFFVVLSGSFLSWLIFHFPYFICLPIVMKLMTLIFIMMGIYLGIEISKLNYYVLFYKDWLNLSSFLGLMWNMPLISTMGLNYYLLYIMKNYKLMDQGWLEFLGTQNLYNNYINMSKFLQNLFFNNLKIYFLIMILWIILILLLF
uniref:NADH-ubiquinone oxidoreductase chain 5 n=1 Tax=Malachiinae sp. GENSP01 TaxID=1205562 RepID=A0A0S2MQH6_9CUCU|nr:NADH deshydrogenase subunit 5 [Malachiinae sp. GENSP01]